MRVCWKNGFQKVVSKSSLSRTISCTCPIVVSLDLWIHLWLVGLLLRVSIVHSKKLVLSQKQRVPSLDLRRVSTPIPPISPRFPVRGRVRSYFRTEYRKQVGRVRVRGGKLGQIVRVRVPHQGTSPRSRSRVPIEGTARPHRVIPNQFV